MRRRGFLAALLALPFAPLAARVATKATAGIPINNKDKFIGLDKALSGSDQTSIWLVEWDPRRIEELYGPAPTLLDVAKRGSYNHLPVIEALQQRNGLLQDMVWKEDGLKKGHKVTWDSRFRYTPTRRGS